jgi:hypothetical protein
VTTVVLGLGTPTATDLAGAALVVAGLTIGLVPGRRRRPTPAMTPAAAGPSGS